MKLINPSYEILTQINSEEIIAEIKDTAKKGNDYTHKCRI
jgi:hypothetical protein